MDSNNIAFDVSCSSLKIDLDCLSQNVVAEVEILRATIVYDRFCKIKVPFCALEKKSFLQWSSYQHLRHFTTTVFS